MKQKLLTVAIAAAAAFSMNTMADVKVYGKANLSLNTYDEADVVKLNSNASRVGVKGSYGISGSTKAVYKLEYEYGADDGASGDFKARNIYAGFAGDWGMIAAGRHDSPTKMAQGKVDRFNDLDYGDIKKTFAQEARANNAVWYASPKANGLQGIIALLQGEKGAKYYTAEDDSIGDGISASLTYDADNFYAALAVDDNIGTRDSIRLVGEYRADIFKIGLMLQNDEPSEGSGDDTDSILISGQVEAATNWIIKGQYSMAETGSAEDELLTLGVDRKLNKKSKVFAYVSDFDAEVDAQDETTFGIGYEVKF